MIRSPKKMVRKGQAMVEYALLVVCIAVVGAVATSMLGHKTADTLAIAAAIMPGAHTDDNNPIQTSQVMPTTIGSQRQHRHRHDRPAELGSLLERPRRRRSAAQLGHRPVTAAVEAFMKRERAFSLPFPGVGSGEGGLRCCARPA